MSVPSNYEIPTDLQEVANDTLHQSLKTSTYSIEKEGRNFLV